MNPNSPAIDAGVAQSVLTFDINDSPRSGVPDLGAYEFGVDAGTPDPIEDPTPTPISDPSPEPSATPDPSLNSIVLAVEGPTSANSGERVAIDVMTDNMTADEIYGIQVEIDYDPALMLVNDLQINPAFSLVVQNNIDNDTGKIRVAASRQGNVAGVRGNVSLISFNATMIGTSGSAVVAAINPKVSNSQAQPFFVNTQELHIVLADTPEPGHTPEPTRTPTDTPTSEPTTEPTAIIPTSEPSPTDNPVPEPTDDLPPMTVFGQVILAGQSGNYWSGTTITIGDGLYSTQTDAAGRFNINSATTITADTSGYLPAVCTVNALIGSETSLNKVALLSGDVNGDLAIDIGDATTVGATFGQTGLNLKADINRDSIIDIFDIVLVATNFGKAGVQDWGCQ